MTPEQHSQLTEKNVTLTAVTECLVAECAAKTEQINTLQSLATARLARIEELSKFLHPVTTGEINDILAWVDVRLKPYEECNPAMERGEHLLESIRQEPEKTVDDTAINVLATALRTEMDQVRRVRCALANCQAKHFDQQERAEKAEADRFKWEREADALRIGNGHMKDALADAIARAERAEAELFSARMDLATMQGDRNAYRKKACDIADQLDKAEAELAECRNALDAIANHMSMDGYGYDAWRNLALEMASVAKAAIDAARKEGQS